MLCLLVAGCNQNDSTKKISKYDSSTISKDSIAKKISTKNDTVSVMKNDTALMNLSVSILKYLKIKDIKKLAEFIDSSSPVRFSPYGYVDTLHDKKLSAKELMAYSKNQKKIHWGIYDGTGYPINLSLNKYFEKFVYDMDFLNAKQKSINKIISGGSTYNNLVSIYPDCDFTQFYFPGSEAKYNGMDWKALVLVFKKDGGIYYLVGLIHDQWRI
jgi:hypothetical protein